MTIKPVVTATEFATLNDVFKTEYKIQGDGSYKLDLGNLHVTDRDPAGLMSALESEREEHKRTKAQADRLDKEAKEAKKAAEIAELQKSGDTKRLEEYFMQQTEELKKEFQKQVDAEKAKHVQQQKHVAEQFRKNKALEIASDLFGKKAPIMLPFIMENLRAIPGEEPRIEILNPAGQPDLAATLETYKKSFLTNPLFEDMIVTSQASGGSANDGTKGVQYKKSDGSPKSFDDYSGGELADMLAKNPTEYERLKAAR